MTEQLKTKKCTKCGNIKPITNFGPTNKSKDGHKSWCKACLCLSERERRIEHGDSIRAKERERRANNIEVRKEQERKAGLKYRSKPGQKEKRSRQLREKNEQAHKDRINVCRICGARFHPEYGKHSWRETCSDACSEEQSKRRKRRKCQVYKARKRSTVIELFDPFDVFVRDKWRCQLCGRKLKKEHRGTKRVDAPELDHIIPISKGGEHSKRNTQCACRKCNQEKGARELGQLRLFG